jgi:hypothetical protein
MLFDSAVNPSDVTIASSTRFDPHRLDWTDDVDGWALHSRTSILIGMVVLLW